MKRVLFLGSGSIAQRHLRNLAKLRPGLEVDIIDPSPKILSQDELPGSLKLGSVISIDIVTGLSQENPSLTWDAAFVCSPSIYHWDQLKEMVALKIPTFIEKPFCMPSETLEAGMVLDQAKENGTPVMVGHNLHYHQHFQRLQRSIKEGDIGTPIAYVGRFGHYLPYWRRDQDSYSRHLDQGGGVLLDCIQDIDLALEIMGKPLESTVNLLSDRTGDVTKDARDFAALHFLGLKGPCSITLDYLRHERIRSVEVMGTEGTLVWESRRSKGSGDSGWESLMLHRISKGIDQLLKGTPPPKVLEESDALQMMDQSYFEELDEFLTWVETGEAPLINPDPLRALKLLEGAQLGR